MILKADLLQAIEEYLLNDITGNNDSLITNAIATAESMAADHLNNRFAVAEIFSATGSNRHKTIMQYVIDITLYLLHKRSNPIDIPQHRKDAYNVAMTALREINEGKITPVGLPVAEDENKELFRVGSQTKRNNQY